MLVLGKILKTMNDYNKYLKELNITENQIQLLVSIDNVKETISDIYYKSDSKIHGMGVFASKNIIKGEIIGDVSKSGKYRTTLGRWVNHSKKSNTSFHEKKDGINMVAIASKDIIKNEEIVVNYRHHTDNIDFLQTIEIIKQLNSNE